MTDLEQEIARLAKMNYKDKFEGIVKVAFQRGELIKLLSGEDEYVYDANGKAWLAPSPCFGPDSNVIDIDRVACMVNNICDDFGTDNIKSILIPTLTEMLNGTPTQLYYAVRIYTQLARLEEGGLSNFSNWVYDQYFTNDFHPIVSSAIQSRINELKNTKIEYIGLLNNLYEWCEICSEGLIRDGFSSITEA